MSQVSPLSSRREHAPVNSRVEELRAVLRRNPDDRVARIKLLEHYFQQGEEHEFLREAALFRNELNGKLDTPDWKAVQSIGLRLFPTSPVFAARPNNERHRRIGEDKKAQVHFEALARRYEGLRDDARFLNELDRELLFVARRPTPLMHAQRLSAHFGGAQIYFKREDLAPPGIHLQIAITGQALLARRLGKRALVTGTVYGQRGLIVAETAARLGMQAIVYMDQRQMASERASVFRMWVMGADVRGVDAAQLRNHDVRESAVEQWLENPEETMLVMGLDHGPEPYPTLVREFSAVIGRELRRQLLTFSPNAPDLIVTRAGNNADAIGVLHPYLSDPRVRLACVHGRKELPAGTSPRDELSAEQRRLTGAILEDMEYPGVAREQRWLQETGRVEYHRFSDESVLETISLVGRLEGLIPAIETAHAISWAARQARTMRPEQSVVIALCERPEKDVLSIGRAMGVPL
jgi:tryptophan synthase beta chain